MAQLLNFLKEKSVHEELKTNAEIVESLKVFIKGHGEEAFAKTTFAWKLWTLIARADASNLAAIEKAFPEQVALWRAYKDGELAIHKATEKLHSVTNAVSGASSDAVTGGISSWITGNTSELKNILGYK